MERKNVLLFALLTATTFNAAAQSSILGLPASAYIDNISHSQAVRQGLIPDSSDADTDNFWTTRRVTASYGFEHLESKTFSSWEVESHVFTPELFLESETGWFLNVGGFYMHSEEDDDSVFGQERESDTYGVSVQPAYDLFTAWNPGNRPEFMERSRLIAGLGMAYAHRDTDVSSSFLFIGSFEFETDFYVLEPNLVFVQPVTENLTAFLIPAYSMQWSRSQLAGGGNASNNDAGLFTLTGRGDYKVCDPLFVSAFATWIRDVNQSSTAASREWAELGAQLRFALSEKYALRAGYSFDASHPYVDGYRCFARFEAGF